MSTSECVADARNAWETGHAIVVKALEKAEDGKLLTAADCRELDVCKALFPDPREFARAVGHPEAVLDWEKFFNAPWRSYLTCCERVIGSGEDLLNGCQDVIVSNLPVDWVAIQKLSAQTLEWFDRVQADLIGNQPTTVSGNEPDLLDVDLAILRYLASQGIAKAQEDIAAGADLDRKTVGKRLDYLRSVNYTRHPDGRSRGNVITEVGLKRLRNLSAGA